MKSRRHSSAGFSLIELMMAIALLVIFIALAMPSFSAWIMNTRIRSTAESIANGLQVARNEAVRRNTSVQFVLDAAGSGWTVSCQNVVLPVCPDTNPIQQRATGEGGNSSITVTPSSSRTIVFNSFGLMTSPAVAGNNVVRFDIDGPDAAESRELRVTIQAGGNVRMCDPQVTGTDPRAC